MRIKVMNMPEYFRAARLRYRQEHMALQAIRVDQIGFVLPDKLAELRIESPYRRELSGQ